MCISPIYIKLSIVQVSEPISVGDSISRGAYPVNYVAISRTNNSWRRPLTPTLHRNSNTEEKPIGQFSEHIVKKYMAARPDLAFYLSIMNRM